MSGPNELLSRLYGTIPGQSKTASVPQLPAGNDPVSKEAAARFAEDDFRGRVMAHAFWQEKDKIAERRKQAEAEMPPAPPAGGPPAGGPPAADPAAGADPGLATQLPPELLAQLQAAGITPEEFIQMMMEEQAAQQGGGAPPAGPAGPPPGPPAGGPPAPPSGGGGGDAPPKEKDDKKEEPSDDEKKEAAAYAAAVDYESQKMACVHLDNIGINPFTLAPYQSEQEKVAAFNQFQLILAEEQMQQDVQEKTAAYVNTVLRRLNGGK